MKNARKSQATIFFILGIVLIIVVVAMLMLSRFAAKKVTKQELATGNEAAFDTTPLKNYVSECLGKITEDAVVLLGSQGGYLYRSQGGTLIDYLDSDNGIFFVNYENHRVAYNILKPRFSIGKYTASLPNYPWGTFPYVDDTKTSTQYIAPGIFGTNSVPVINQSFGQHSMQEQIMLYVDRNVDSCLADSVFENLGFKVQKHNKSISVAINENDITLVLDYMMQIENLATNDKTTLQLFTTKVPIRLGALREFVNALVESEINDIKFNIANDTSKEDFVVQLVNDYSSKDDIVIITDTQTKINEQDYQYVFARKNRNPALFLLPTPITYPHFAIITNNTILSNNTNLAALDPDEEPIAEVTIFPDYYGEFILPSMEYKVEISDGALKDYQMITLEREVGT